MRIFVTGGTGWIGSAVISELLDRGHRVVGLARSDAAAERLLTAGADVHPGSLDDLDALRAGAAAADGVAHLAFQHDLAFAGDFATAAVADRAAIEVFGEALAAAQGPLTIASGTGGVAPGRFATEHDAGEIVGGASERFRNEQVALDLADDGVRSSVVRFSTTVHGVGDHGASFVALIAAAARANGVSGYLGDGENRWPAVHRDDAARLVVDSLERAPAGSVLHAVGEEGVPFRSIAAALGAELDLPTRSLGPEEAERLGFLGAFIGADIPASSELTRELLGWVPTGPTLIEDIAAGAYTAAAVGSSG